MMWAGVQNRLSLCHGTLATVSPPEFVSAAASAGFRRVSLKVLLPKSTTPVKIMGGSSLTGDSALRRETRRRLDDTGVTVVEAEAAVLGPATAVAEFELYMESAATLGAVGVIAVFFGQTSKEQVLAQFSEFAALADQYGRQAIIEFIPVSAIKTIGAAEGILRKSGVKNGRIMVDSLHWTRSGGTVADLRAGDPAMIHGAQISDGKIDFPNDGLNWWEEMSMKRSFLGEGDFKVVEMLQALPPHVPVGIEVISREFQDRGLSPNQMARYALENARDYFRRTND